MLAGTAAMKHSLTLALSLPHRCSYLPKEQSQEAFVLPEDTNQPIYQRLIDYGFRRSGDLLYRPHCAHCQSCQSLRVDVQLFTPSRSQKRILNKNKDIIWLWAETLTDAHYQLYQRYQRGRHHGGEMEKQTQQDFLQFLSCDWNQPAILEGYLDGQLIAVAVMDTFDQGASAVYSFFDPKLASRSLGKLLIMHQLEWLSQLGKAWLYLGYQIDQCQKMSYKRQFQPHQRFINGQWRS